MNNTGKSCRDECDEKCCSGTDACTGFTGKICKDGSCNLVEACYYAAIPLVVNSCKGEYSCFYADRVRSMVNSCNGYGACSYVGYNSSVSATRFILDSCNGYYACGSAAYNGSIGNITSSCNATYACLYAGSPPPNGTGPIHTNLTNCCNSESACKSKKESTLPAQCFPVTPVRSVYDVL